MITRKAELCVQPCSTQWVELTALTEACKMAENDTVNIYTDSAYAHGVCHLFGATWKARGFKKTDGSPIQHHDQVIALMEVMMLPLKIAIINCQAQKDSSLQTRGNNAKDAAAKFAATSDLKAVSVNN